jgi:hypothetical protein
MSNNGVGMRINSVARIVIIPTATIILLREFDTVLSSPGFGKLDVSETAITIYSPVQSLLGLFLVRRHGGPENFLYSDSEPVFDYNNISGSEPDVFQIQIRRYINGFIEFQYRTGAKLQESLDWHVYAANSDGNRQSHIQKNVDTGAGACVFSFGCLRKLDRLRLGL